MKPKKKSLWEQMGRNVPKPEEPKIAEQEKPEKEEDNTRFKLIRGLVRRNGGKL